MKMKRTNLYAGLVLAAVALAGCEDKPKTVNADQVDEAGAKKAAVDPALAKAVAAASAHSKAAPVANQPGAPPMNGIFAPGAADKAMPRGTEPKVVLGEAGKTPRVQLEPLQPKPGFRKKAKLTLTLRGGGGLLPPLDLALKLETKRAKGAKPGSKGPVDATATIESAEVPADQRAQVPPAFVDRISGLKGSRITYSILPDGAGRNFSYDMSTKAKGLDTALDALVEAFSAMTIPVPDKPVGVGAMWMVTTRGMVAGVDVVSYRLVKVEAITGDHVKLSVNAKRYAASDHVDVPRLPTNVGKVKLAQFASTSNGSVDIDKGVPLPTGVELTQILQAPIVPVEHPKQPVANMQSATTVKFALAQSKATKH